MLEPGDYRLEDLIKRKGQKFYYVYDFGDSWEYELLVEDSNYVNPNLKADMACLEGARACPPEDVGGVYPATMISVRP